MIPNIFVSSTIEDLHHLRDAVRETIAEIGYYPILSDYGDIGYSPLSSAEDACYATIKDCQIAVLLIGKRYGSKSKNGLSITHNEFHSARDQGIPVISVVDREVMSFKKVFDANKSKNTQEHTFPGMDNAVLSFSFIQEIIDAPINNGILTFSKVSEVRDHLKKQIAHLFGELLLQRFDPLKSQVQDVLSEIKTLRYELLKDKGSEPIRYLKATKFLFSQKYNQTYYRALIEQLVADIDSAIPILLNCKTFSEFIDRVGGEIKIRKDNWRPAKEIESGKIIMMTETLLSPLDAPPEERVIARWAILMGKKIIFDKEAKRLFDRLHEEFLRETTI